MTVWLDNERPYRRQFALSVGACEHSERVCSLELSGSVARPRLYEVDSAARCWIAQSLCSRMVRDCCSI